MDPTPRAEALERATPGDVITLAMDPGPLPSQVGAILRFAGGPGGGEPAALQPARYPACGSGWSDHRSAAVRRSGWTTLTRIRPATYA